MTIIYDTQLGTIPDTVIHKQSSDDIISVSYYTLDGKRAEPHKGIYIRVIYYRDGHSSASKILNP